MPFFKNVDNFFGSRFFLRIVSLFVALVLWFYVNGDIGGNMEKEMSCDVQFLNLSSELTLTSELRKVDIGVEGKRDVIADLTPRDLLCEVDIRGLAPGKYRLPIKVILPAGVKLGFIRPPNMEVSLLRYAEKVLPIHVSVVGGLPAGLLMDAVDLSPTEVTVRGPEEDLASIKEVQVQPTVDELQKGEKLTLSVKLIQSEGADDSLTVYPSEVDLTAILRKGLPRKTLPVDISVSGSPAEGVEVKTLVVTPSMIEIEGPEKAIKKIDKVETETIDLTGFDKDRSMIVPLRPVEDEEVRFIGETSVSVKVMLKPKTENRLFSGVPVVTKGRSVYPGWEVSPQTVDVRLEGPSKVMKSLEDSEIPFSVYVDVTNIVSRQLRVPVTIALREKELKIVSVAPERVTVKAKID
ncbi:MULTISPECIES: CdaR family protein [Dethiosulfovibrio]|uniref:YbbR-like domain-containing protein n=2 Tax=Dethiosulfovibrio TaxID=47054 RepID=A0ABS9EQ98_9BACT|nr:MULTISPECIES: CdaR family protein [Dethiosulfovibrio]MCF4115039.1 hypothetical protein [Dethiosulfovibrio russensis]MCF4143362.1 hypothetical protein [Dethiosulfovibrio marinus]MCF4145519.1 hypothetical protein [Dethiosulfovibrio acidaminovorans]